MVDEGVVDDPGYIGERAVDDHGSLLGPYVGIGHAALCGEHAVDSGVDERIHQTIGLLVDVPWVHVAM